MKKIYSHKIVQALSRMHEPTTELHFTSPYELLVAVMLSARNKDKRVNVVTSKLFKEASTPKALIALGEEKLKDHLRTLGLHNAKTSNVLEMSRILVKRFHSSVPSKLENLIELPGVGRKTAQVVLNVLYGAPYISVDTHVLRLANRIGFSKGHTPLMVERDMVKAIPKEYHSTISRMLVRHGRYICVARSPKCQQCPLKEWCVFYRKNVKI